MSVDNTVSRWGAPLLASATGPEDEFDDSANGDPDSLNGEEDESGFDDMPLLNGWEDEGDEEDEDGEEDEEE